MSVYTIERYEHLYGWWHIKADSREEAEEIWEEMKANGNVDYSGMDLYDADEKITETDDYEEG